MLPTLFYIPNEIVGVPFLRPQDGQYGFGLLLAVVLLCGGVMLYGKFRREGASGDFLGMGAMLALMCGLIVFVAPYLTDEHGLPIRGYGVMVLLAVLSAVVLAVRRARQVGARDEIILSLMFSFFLLGIVGARALYVWEYWEHFQRDTLRETLLAVIDMTKGGLVVYGSFLGASVAVVWYAVRYRLPMLPLADLLVASLLLGQGLGRVGCLLNGCCFGGVCEQPSPLPAMRFPFGSPAHRHQVERDLLPLHGLTLETKGGAGDANGNHRLVAVKDVQPGSEAEHAGVQPGQVVLRVGPKKDKSDKRQRKLTRSLAYEQLFAVDGQYGREVVRLRTYTPGETPIERQWTVAPPLPRSQHVHPTQIYSAVNGLLMCLFAWLYFPFRRRDGEVFAVMLSIFPISRFLMEWVRSDEPANFLAGLTISQTISVGLLLSAIPFWYFVLRQPRGSMMGPEDWAQYNQRWAELNENGEN